MQYNNTTYHNRAEHRYIFGDSQELWRQNRALLSCLHVYICICLFGCVCTYACVYRVDWCETGQHNRPPPTPFNRQCWTRQTKESHVHSPTHLLFHFPTHSITHFPTLPLQQASNPLSFASLSLSPSSQFVRAFFSSFPWHSRFHGDRLEVVLVRRHGNPAHNGPWRRRR